jgi:hypothetical protein
LIVAELINNINLVQRATTELNTVKFSTSLKLFIRRIFASKRQALPKQQTTDEDNFIRVGRKFKLSSDHIVINHLHNIHSLNFSTYKTCWKKNVQFSIYDSNSTTQNSDSCILFQTIDQTEMGCGFIVAITSQLKQQCSLIIHTVLIDRRDSLTFKKKHIVNPFIFQGYLTDPPNLITIDIQDILVKIAHSKVDNIFHFFQYPNTVEST